MTNYCVISHTHWDREWYLPLENFRMRLVDLIDNLLDILDKDDKFRFHLDAQTIVLEDYLAIRPHKRSVLEGHIKAGRILVGPWYVQNDFHLTSGEATVRNLIVGRNIAEEFGGCMNVGYAADQFGLVSQLPQILSRFGLDSCIFGRGFNMGRPTPLEFKWRSEDGSEVLCEHMAHWYNNAQRFPEDAEGALSLIHHRRDAMKERVTTSNYLLMNGVDHLEAQENLSAVIETVKPHLEEGERFFQDTFPEFLSRVRAELEESGKELDVYTGELRHGGSRNVLTGTLAARVDLKLENADCQASLENLLEPLCAICDQLGVKSYPSDYMRYLWKLLIENHPHDSICGCSADAVHRHMHDRFARIHENVSDLVTRYSTALINHICRDGLKPSQYLILVMNTLQSDYNRGVRVRVEIPTEEDLGSFVISDAKGGEVAFRVNSVKKEQGKQVLSPINLPGEKEVNVYDLTLDLPAIKGFSYEVLTLTLKEGELVADPDGKGPKTRMENDFLKIQINKNGTVNLTHKESGRRYRGLFLLEDNMDRGDSYLYKENDGSEIITSAECQAKISVIEENELVQSRRVEYELVLDREGGKWTIPVCMELTLEKESRYLDCKLTLTNTAEDHRLRMHFPTDIKTDKNYSGSPFDQVIRPQKSPYKKDRQHPNTAYVGLEKNGRGMAVLNSGLYEYEHLKDGTLALTLLRAVGRISGDWKLRHKVIETWKTEDSQMKTELTYRIAVYPYSEDSVSAEVAQTAAAFARKPVTFVAPVDYNKLVGGRAFVQVAGMPDLFYRPLENADKIAPVRMTFVDVIPSVKGSVALSAVKGSENGRGFVVRGYNLTSEPVSVELVFAKKYAHIDRLSLGEDYVENLALDSDRVIITLAPKEIFTVGVF